MNKLYKSVTLNFMALLGILSFILFSKALFDIFIQNQSGAGDFFAFMYLPASFLYILFVIIGLTIEYICMKSGIKYAFNFPYEKMLPKNLYYALFCIGIIWGVLPVLYIMIFR